MNHASLIRPINDTGKLRVVKDSTELEYLLSQFLQSQSLDLSLLEEYIPYREFRKLLFQQLPDIIDPKLDVILVCHHLISRSDVIRLPYQLKNWNQVQYCDFIDGNRSEAITLLNKCLDEVYRFLKFSILLAFFLGGRVTTARNILCFVVF